MIRVLLATMVLLASAMLGSESASAGPRLVIGFVNLPTSLQKAACSSSALEASKPFFSNAEIKSSGNVHAYDTNYTLILFCDTDMHQAYVLVAGVPAITFESTTQLKDQIKAKMVSLIPGATPG